MPAKLPTAGRVTVEKASSGHRSLRLDSRAIATVWPSAESQANAERLARCWNTHEALVEALGKLLAIHNDGRQFDLGCNRPSYIAWLNEKCTIEEQARQALTQAR